MSWFMFEFYLVWPYMGLGAALLLALLLCTNALRSDLAVSRWQDLVWLAWAGTLAYLIHQFEEHGVDALGVTYAFRTEMCRNIGSPTSRPAPSLSRSSPPSTSASYGCSAR